MSPHLLCTINRLRADRLHKVDAARAATKAQEVAAKVLPDRVKAKLHATMAEPGGDDQS